MIDIVKELDAIHRETGRQAIPGGEARTVVLRRSYRAGIDDVWDALTNPERIPRWFLPISGDLRLGGKYQLEGNAGGEIVRCEPPRLLKVTWVFGEASANDVSEVEVSLSSADGGDTVFELKHTATVDPAMWAEYGPGAVGVGWDLAVLGLGLYLSGGEVEDRVAWTFTPEAREFMTGSSKAWGAAHEAFGASGDDVRRMVENTTKFYAPDPESTQDET